MCTRLFYKKHNRLTPMDNLKSENTFLNGKEIVINDPDEIIRVEINPSHPDLLDGDLFTVDEDVIKRIDVNSNHVWVSLFDFESNELILYDYINNKRVGDLSNLDGCSYSSIGNMYITDFKKDYMENFRTFYLLFAANSLNELTSYELENKSPDEVIYNVLNLKRMHSLTNEEWYDFKIDIIKFISPVVLTSAIRQDNLKYFLENDLDSKFNDSNRKIAILESIFDDFRTCEKCNNKVRRFKVIESSICEDCFKKE